MKRMNMWITWMMCRMRIGGIMIVRMTYDLVSRTVPAPAPGQYIRGRGMKRMNIWITWMMCRMRMGGIVIVRMTYRKGQFGAVSGGFNRGRIDLFT